MMSISISFPRAIDVADPSMAVTKELLISLAVALFAGAVWTTLCLLLGWPLLGVMGIALGVVVGSATCACLRADAGPLAGMTAALLAMVVLLAGALLERGGENRGAIADAESDESYIATIAEQIAWRRAIPTLDEHGQPLPTATTNTGPAGVDAPPGIPPAEIPAEIRHEAEARWQAMPAEEKQKLRDERQRWMVHTLGAELNRFERKSTGWPLGTVAALTGVAALLSAAWPALVGRYVRGER